MNTNCEMPRSSDEVPASWCYRLPRSYLMKVGLCTAFIFVVGVGSTIAAYWNIDGSFPQPELAALISGVIWSCMTLLGLFAILLYFRYRLYVSDDAITHVGCLGTKTVRLSRVSRVVWRTIWLGGSVVVRGETTKIAIHFRNFPVEQRLELVAFIRDHLDTQCQQGWSPFEERVLKSGWFLM